MTGIDSDVLVIHHAFTGDNRYAENALFMEKSAQHKRGVTIYNLLELCGVVTTARKPSEARALFQQYFTAADIEVLYPDVRLDSPTEYWAFHNEVLMERIERGMRLGDAVILWAAESSGCTELVTWNKRHFEGKTDLALFTPAEWLREYGYL